LALFLLQNVNKLYAVGTLNKNSTNRIYTLLYVATKACGAHIINAQKPHSYLQETTLNLTYKNQSVNFKGNNSCLF